MKIRKSNIIIATVCTAALSTASFFSGYAAANGDTPFNSQGKIIFDNGTEDTVDDVIFDASDFFTIDNMVADGKTGIRDALNEYDSVDIDEDIPAFDTLVDSIIALSDGTNAAEGDILSGKKALVGKSLVTGSMADRSNSKTSADKIVENGKNAEITIPGGYYDGDSKITIPVDTIKQALKISCNIREGGSGGTFTLNFDPVLVVAYGEGNGKPVIAWRYKDGRGQGVAGYNGDTSPSVTISGRTITIGSWCTNGWIAVG